MRLFSLGFVAALAMAFFGQQAMAADAFKVDPKIQAQSMKDAPALVQAAGLDCNLVDAYKLGSTEEKVNGKNVKSDVYELACGPGALGYIVVDKPGGEPTLFDCLTLKEAADKAIANKQKPGNTCRLPENQDPKTGLLPLLTKGGVTDCGSVTNAGWLGASAADKLNVFEAACADGSGYIVLDPLPHSAKTLQVINCAKEGTVGVTCALTSPEQISQHIIKLLGASGQPGCSPTKARWVVTDAAKGDDYWEVGCSDGKTSFMFQTSAKGSFESLIPCVRATRIAGGCTFSNVDAGQTADIPTYQKLIQQVQYPCQISKYQSYGAETNGQREIVEVACSDHPDGAFALVPTGAGQTGAYYNCVRAMGIIGLTCHLSPISATYAKISSQIAARGKVTCNVDNARAIGKDAKGQDYVEVTCGAAPSLVLTYSRLPQETLISAVPCAEAPIANACTLKK